MSALLRLAEAMAAPQIARFLIPTLERLRSQTQAWTQQADRQRVRIQWNFTGMNARQKFGYVKNISMRSKTSTRGMSSDTGI